MLLRQALLIRNEEEDSSVGDRDGGDSPPPLPPLSRRQLFSSDSRPFRMRDAFVSHLGVTQCTKCGKPDSGICAAYNHWYAFSVVNLVTL